MEDYDEGQSKRTKACVFLIAIVAATVALFLSMQVDGRWCACRQLGSSPRRTAHTKGNCRQAL